MKKIPVAIIFLLMLCPFYFLSAQYQDWRNVTIGAFPIYINGYCDQPYVVILPGGKWLCVFTTGEGAEGTGGQHIVSTLSEDHGRTWTKPVKIEKPGSESASWAMPYVTSFGRVYVFYDYNGDKIHTLREQKNIREDMLGWYCYRYSDDEGKTWSRRYRLDVRKTNVDYANDWKGKVQILWGIGKPVDVDQGMMFAFSKIRHYLLDDSEGWYFRCDNINTEKDVSRLRFVMLPDGDNGVKNSAYGPVNSEQNLFQLNNGSLYCMHRTISGYPLESYSFDGGKSWTLPLPPRYETGIALKTPRACPRIWKCKNGKYLFWYHNHSGKTFADRNPVWISGGIEKDGKIYWGQPEILLYEPNINVRMSYPDLIEQDGKYWITETNKENARCHEIPVSFMEMLWKQFDICEKTTSGLCFSYGEALLFPGNLSMEGERIVNFEKGVTFDFCLELSSPAFAQILFKMSSRCGRKNIIMQTGLYGDIELIIDDGEKQSKWNSDPGLISVYGKHHVTVTIDNGPKIIQFVVDGNVCNGNNSRQYGWGRFVSDITDFEPDQLLITKLKADNIRPGGKLLRLDIYNRPLLNTEIIGIHRYYKSK